MENFIAKAPIVTLKLNLCQKSKACPAAPRGARWAPGQGFYSGIRICRIARIQAIRFLIRTIRKMRIQKAFSCLVSARRELADTARPRWDLCKKYTDKRREMGKSEA
jgi:hypothetical protein